MLFVIFFFKQKTAYEMRISDWSSDVCSSDLAYAERAYYALARAVLPKLDLSIRAQRDAYDELREKLSAKYFCNFRSEERRVGKECVSTCRSRWSPYH